MTMNAINDAVARIVAQLGENQFVLTSSWGGEDDAVDGYIDGGNAADIMSAAELLERAQREFLDDIGEKEFLRLLGRMTDLPTFVGIFNDCFAHEDEHERLVSHVLWQKMERTRRRRELEASASNFLRRNRLARIDCLEAIKRIFEELETLSSREEQHFSGECRRERYMSHRLSGASHAYWDNEDYDREEFYSERENLESLLQYLQEYFPLIWAEWESRTV